MGGKTGISWTDATWNPTVGCSRVSPGCEHCYAERVAHRAMQPAHEGLTTAGDKGPRWNGEVRCLPNRLEAPLRWRKPRRIFVNSMSDLFHERVPDEFIADVFTTMALAEQHTFQVLTKRPERMRSLLGNEEWWMLKVGAMCEYIIERRENPSPGAMMGFDAWWGGIQENLTLPNVHLGVSVEDQKRADERIPLLLQTPAAVRFLSCEPLLGPLDLVEAVGCRHEDGYHEPDTNAWQCRLCEHETMTEALESIDWIIVGGESGPGARPCNVEWIRSIVEQCGEADVPVFVKQLGKRPLIEFKDWQSISLTDAWTGISEESDVGEMRPIDSKGADPHGWPEDLRVQEFPA